LSSGDTILGVPGTPYLIIDIHLANGVDLKKVTTSLELNGVGVKLKPPATVMTRTAT
jgi:hypothetical protein